jgi:hypothetical protein
MRTAPIVLALSVVLLLGEAMACSMRPGWSPPTPAGALSSSEVVLHAKVLSVKSDQRGYYSDARISVIQVLKGSFSGDVVSTSGSSLCGIGDFSVGRHYVFFFPRRGDWHVAYDTQPQGLSSGEILSAIHALPAKERLPVGRLVKVQDWDLPPYESPLFNTMARDMAIPVSVVFKPKKSDLPQQ